MPHVLVPLTRPLAVGGVDVTFPLRMAWSKTASVLVTAPRRTMQGFLGASGLRPVPAGVGLAPLVISYHAWTDTPVGPFEEVILHAPAFLGRGSPVPLLAPMLHGLWNVTDAVGQYGISPLRSLVSSPEAAAFRSDLYRVPAHVVPVRVESTGSDLVVQCEYQGDPLLRLMVKAPKNTAEKRTMRLDIPLYGEDHGTLWGDVGEARLTPTYRRFRPGGGHFALFASGPLIEFAYAIGGPATSGYRRRALATEMSGAGWVRLAGPRPVHPTSNAR